MLLIKFQTLKRWLVRRQQIEDVHVEAQPRQTEADGDDEQQPPPAVQKGPHGDKNPSTVSPVREFSKRQPPSVLLSKRSCFGKGFPASAVGRYSQLKRVGPGPRPLKLICRCGNFISQKFEVVCAERIAFGVLSN